MKKCEKCGTFATYTIYYSTSGNKNYAPVPEASITVTIAEVDKTALSAIIGEVNKYYDTIVDDYSKIAATLNGHRQNIETSFLIITIEKTPNK